MEKSIRFANYILAFILKPSFQDKQKWVKWLISRLSVIGPNYWTGSRFFGGIATIVVSAYFWGLSIVVFLLFALTDFVDGKVARYLKVANGNQGAFLDALADKIFVIPIIWFWGWPYASHFLLWTMTGVEVGGNILLFALNLIFKNEKKGIYDHLNVGKYKFGLQVFLVCLLWFIEFVPSWAYWPATINIVLFVITVFAASSVLFKVTRYFSRTGQQ